MTKGKFKISTYTNPNAELSAKEIKYSFDSLASEDSGRNAGGGMVVTFIKPKLRKWQITMPPMETADAYALMNAIQGQKYNITIYDLAAGGDGTPVYVYTSKSSCGLYSGVIRGGLWIDFTFSAIEMG